MRIRGLGLAFSVAAWALAAGGAGAQLMGPDRGDGLPAPPPAAAAPSFWTPSAVRSAMLDEPIAGGSLPRGFAVLRIESRRPTPGERAAGMAYRIDVLLNGPYPQQSLSYRVYDTIDAARAAGDDATLGDAAVTLTVESLAAPMQVALPEGRAGLCARVRSAAFPDLVFMRCHAAFAGLPVVVSGAIGGHNASLMNEAGEVDQTRLDLEKHSPLALLRAGLAQLTALYRADPTGERAYTRDHVGDAPAAAVGPPR